jgi:hypothetical protein
VAHTHNPSYLGSRDQEDCISKPAWAGFEKPYLEKNPSQKKGWWSGSSDRGPEFKPCTAKKKKKTLCLGQKVKEVRPF